MKLSGTALAHKKLEIIKQRIANSGVHPKLAVIRIGNDAASEIYVNRKKKIADDVGIEIELFEREIISTELLVAEIKALNERDDVHAILVQVPLPESIDTDAVIAAIDPSKDVDGFHGANIEAYMNDESIHTPVLLLAVQWLLEETEDNLDGKSAHIIGKSDIFLKPLAHALEKLGLETEWTRPEDLLGPEQTSDADVLIVAVGSPQLITGEFVKPGAIVIDIGINRLENGRIVGDVAYEEVEDRAAWVTPTPGGVGPVTIAALMWNTLQLALDSANGHHAESFIENE